MRANRDIPNFVIAYVGRDVKEVDKFLDKWTTHSEISLNFKLVQNVNQPIGAKIKRSIGKRRSQSRSRSEGSSDDDRSSQEESRNGLALRLDIDNRKHTVTRLYVSFGKESTVHIIDHKDAFIRIRDKLGDFLGDSYVSATSMTATQRRENFVPIKLYTQDIVLTYKVLYAAFNLDSRLLNRYFEWHAFDVAWWMVNDCPNRGLNNCRSSLSLVTKTSWASNYHHFLYASSRSKSYVASRPSRRDRKEYLKLKDIVKAGKTAILKPLIDEILAELSARNQTDAYYEAEIPSRLTIAHMMINGVGLNIKSMKNELKLYEDLTQQLSAIAQKYYAKSTISLTNIRHIARVLYEDLNLRRYLLDHNTNSDISKDPTNGEILNILAQYHPFPKLVQDFRKVEKALDALQSVNTHARFNSDLKMMRVFGHCDFWQLTGRVSMFDPDLFLINRNFKVLIPAHGNRAEEEVDCAPRRCFVPFSDWVMVAADYSQLELRLLAHFSDDVHLLEILNRSLDSDNTFDVFKTIASRIYRIPIEDVTNENRQHAKQICYGIVYGMGNKSLAIHLGVDVERAEEFREDFFNSFPRIRAYTQDLIEECGELGYVKSLLGRRRLIDGIKSDNSSRRSKAERVAVNTRIQSSASDIIKLAMQRMNQKILENFERSARLVLEMHDELIYEVDPCYLDRFCKTLKFTMENLSLPEAFRVKLLVRMKKGTDWSSLQNFNADSSGALSTND